MYSHFKSVQILISALKQYEVRDIVLSPGGSDIPIIHSLETDNYFHCYSVVDERSAVYFGIGLSQSLNKPVACVCTSGTAVSNYLPGMTEAYYQNVPIIAITADKDPYFQGQIETQKIEQKNIFGEVSLKSVELPLCKIPDEYWYCERLIKEAITTSLSHSKGPVHINIPLVGSYNGYEVNQLPTINPVKIIDSEDNETIWNSYIELFSKAKRILIIVGQNVVFTKEDKKNIERFFQKYNSIISVEHISNLKCQGCVFTYPVTETGLMKKSNNLVPDLVISLGNNVASYGMKPFLRNHHSEFRHISIDKSGRYRDVFKSLTDIFECSPSYFFKYFANNAPESIENDKKYYNEWNNLAQSIVLPEFEFSNFYVAQRLASVIPENSLLHSAILNSTRIMHFFELKENIRVFSNVGALGIDGCLSTFIGQAAATNELAFCIIGDLSFFYDMNAAGIKHIGKNVRIILLNNGGGSEFHFFMDKKKIPTLNDFICAQHQKTAQGWIESLGFNYFSAHTKEELENCIQTFGDKSDYPLFLEVFTDQENDARLAKEFYHSLAPKPTIIDQAKSVVKKIIKIVK